MPKKNICMIMKTTILKSFGSTQNNLKKNKSYKSDSDTKKELKTINKNQSK